jgi:hypothetical protein
MQRETALELANEWHDLVRGDRALEAQDGNLTSALTRLLPETIARGGAAIVNGAPSVIACDETAVYVIGFAPTDEGKLDVQFARHPLAAGASISGRDDFDSELIARIRHWRFTWPSSVEIAFTSVTDRRGGWENGPDSADGVARYMANAFGWELPASGNVR